MKNPHLVLTKDNKFFKMKSAGMFSLRLFCVAKLLCIGKSGSAQTTSEHEAGAGDFDAMNDVPTFAQNSHIDSVSKQGWLSLGSGVMGNRDFFGLGGLAGFSYLTENRLISIRLSNIARISMAEPALNDGTYGSQAYRVNNITDISALYGVAKKYKSFLVSLSTGAGLVVGKESNKRIERSYTTIGLPFDVRVLITPFPVLGVGVIGSANLNAKTTFTSIMFGFRLGKLK